MLPAVRGAWVGSVRAGRTGAAPAAAWKRREMPQALRSVQRERSQMLFSLSFTLGRGQLQSMFVFWDDASATHAAAGAMPLQGSQAHSFLLCPCTNHLETHRQRAQLLQGNSLLCFSASL